MGETGESPNPIEAELNTNAQQTQAELPERITREITLELPEPDGTLIHFQRHEEYDMDPESPTAGKLTPEGKARQQERAHEMYKKLIEETPEEDRDSLRFAVFASPTRFVKDGAEGGFRSLETGNTILDEIRELMNEYDLDPSQLLNNDPKFETVQELLNTQAAVSEGGAWGTGPIPAPNIVEPRMFADNPEFVDWLKQHVQEEISRRESQGETSLNPIQMFWQLYETDEGIVQEQRLAYGAEGPLDIADRTANFLNSMRLFSEGYHRHNPGRRLVIGVPSHYDTLSPYVKSRIGGTEEIMKGYLPVDHGAGINIKIDPEGNSSATINDKAYPLTVEKTSDDQHIAQLREKLESAAA